MILQNEPGNLNCGICPNKAKHHNQEASILASTSIVQMTLITLEQRLEDFCFEIIGMVRASECRLQVSTKVNKE